MMEKRAEEIEVEKINSIERELQGIRVLIIIISLKKLIVGGAEMFTEINRNHQNIMLGEELIIPLNDKMFRV